LDYLKQIAKAYPRRRLHIVLDGYYTHKHDDINQCLTKHPRITLHFTSTSGSWLNLVEVRFGIVTRQAIGAGSFDSVRRRRSTGGSARRCAAVGDLARATSRRRCPMLVGGPVQSGGPFAVVATLSCEWNRRRWHLEFWAARGRFALEH
jgi:hypothetical protein